MCCPCTILKILPTPFLASLSDKKTGHGGSDGSFLLIRLAVLPQREPSAQRSLILGIAVAPWCLRERDCCFGRAHWLLTGLPLPMSIQWDHLLFSLSTQCLVGARTVAVRARCRGKRILLLQGTQVVGSLIDFFFFLIFETCRKSKKKY